MIDLTPYTFKSLLQELLLIIPDDINKREGSLARTAASLAAYVHEGLYMELANVERQAFYQTATGDNLDLICKIRNVMRKEATPSRWTAVFNVPPTVGDRLAARDTQESITYTVTGEPKHDDDTGLYVAEVTCEEAGSIGNSYSGVLSPVDFIAGLTTCYLKTLTYSGTDTETDDALRQRFETSLVEIAFGGNVAAYKEFISAIEGVGAVQVWGCYDSTDNTKKNGHVTCVIVDEDFTAAEEGLIAEVQEKVDPNEDGEGLGMAPIGAKVHIITPTETTVNVSVSVVGSVSEATVKQTIEDYVSLVRHQWNTPTRSGLNYVLTLYRNMLIGRIAILDGVTNVTSLSFNGVESDFVMTEYTGGLLPVLSSQIPVIGTITVTRG